MNIKPKHLAYRVSSILSEKFAKLKWPLPRHLSNWTPSSPVWELRVPGESFWPHTKATPQSAANGLSPLPWHIWSERTTRKEETLLLFTEPRSYVKVVVATLYTLVRWRCLLRQTQTLCTLRAYIIFRHCSPGEVRTYTATDSESAYTDNLDKLCPASSRLHLKVRAQVCITLDVISVPMQGSCDKTCVLFCDKTCFVVTKVCLSWQKYVCHVKSFVTTSTHLFWQKM